MKNIESKKSGNRGRCRKLSLFFLFFLFHRIITILMQNYVVDFWFNISLIWFTGIYTGFWFQDLDFCLLLLLSFGLVQLSVSRWKLIFPWFLIFQLLFLISSKQVPLIIAIWVFEARWCIKNSVEREDTMGRRVQP